MAQLWHDHTWNAVDSPRARAQDLVLPGLVSLHSHAFQRGLAGQAERRGAGDDSFWTWREAMYRFLDRLTPEDVHAIAAQAYVDMLERGFTHVVEFHYLHHDPSGQPYANQAAMAEAIVAAAAETGIGLTLLPTLYRFGGFGSLPATAGQRRFLNTRDGFERLLAASSDALSGHPGATLGVALHSLRAVAPEDVRDVAAMRPGTPIHIHVAEQEAEVAACRAWSGTTPVAWLLDHATVDPRWCLIHATHMTAAEIRDLAATGAVAGLCPVTEANLGDGIFPAVDFLAAGGRIGVGTDSNVLISVAEELRTLEYGQRLRDRRRARLAPVDTSVADHLFSLALAGGRQAAGLSAQVDSGQVILNGDDPVFAGAAASERLDRAVFTSPTLPVRDVWCQQGRRLVAEGTHIARAAIAARYRRSMARLRDTA